MAENLLNHFINGKINTTLLIQWLVMGENAETEEIISDFNVGHTDFLTYLLNFIHENISVNGSNAGLGDTLLKRTSIISQKNEEKAIDNTLRRSLNSNLNPKLEGKLNSSPHLESQNNSCHLTDSIEVLNNSRITSTPILHKSVTEVNCTRDLSYISPISPIHNSHDNSLPAESNKHGFNSRKVGSRSLCLGDFIINKKTSVQKKNKSVDNCEELLQKRRINPTNLTQKKVNSNFRKSKNSFNFDSSFEEIPLANSTDHRSFLVEERKKIIQSSNCTNDIFAKKVPSVSNFIKNYEKPIIKKVTNVAQLDRLINIYVSILNANMVLNVTSEIYFLISLLLNKPYSAGGENNFLNHSLSNFNLGVNFLNDSDEKRFGNILCKNDRSTKSEQSVLCSELFDNIHNIVYFSVKSLEAQIDVLKFYDKLTLKLLSENEQVLSFSPHFVHLLRNTLFNKAEKSNKEETIETCLQTSVCFNVDTDNSQNFLNQGFHAFRKQRDLFYEILRIWETSHVISGWDFSSSLSGRIRSLFTYSVEPTNFMHFARLFKAQLLSNCKNHQREEGLCIEQLPFLSSLPNMDTEKLNLLKNRIVTKQQSNGINSVPEFHGHQEFYKNFIVVASSHAFNKHLCDCLISEIIELNDGKIFSTDFEDEGANVDATNRNIYLCRVKSLRVLAKFLGFVESLPYMTEGTHMSEDVLDAHIKSRLQTGPSLHVAELLMRATRQNTLVLLIPWLTVYLSLLDYVTLRLPYYINVHKCLFKIYKKCSRKSQNFTPYNCALIKFSLGWLFELAHFPDSEFFKFCTDFNSKDNAEKGSNFSKCDAIQHDVLLTLDQLDIVNHNILYVCCPFLDEIKRLLSSNASQKRITVKHITPVTAALPSKDVAKKKLELQLEEAFLNGQPGSLRKTIEFVSERVASSIVKHICKTVVPYSKNIAVNEVKKFLEIFKDTCLEDRDHCKSVIKTESTKISQKHYESLKKQCEEITAQISLKQTLKSIEGLVSVDLSSKVRDAAVTIGMRYCRERVKQWTDSNVTPNVFAKEFDAEFQKVWSGNCDGKHVPKENKLVFVLPPSGKDNIKHNENALSGFHMLEKIRSCCCDVIENQSSVTKSSLSELLQESLTTLTQRNDVNECISASICTTLLDYALLLVSRVPYLMSDSKIFTDFVTIFQCYCGEKSDLFKDLLSDRNIMLVTQSNTLRESWETFAKFVDFLIQSGLLSSEDFESQCLGLFRNDWDQEVIKAHKYLKVMLRKNDIITSK